VRRPLEKEQIYLDGGRRTTQLMRDSLGSMSTDALFALLLLLGVTVYATAATFIARGSARRYLPIIAAVVAVISVATVLAPAYVDRKYHWLNYQGDIMYRMVVAYTVAASILTIPAVIVTTKLAIHFAATSLPPIKSWLLNWGAGIAVPLLCVFVAVWAAIVISGDGP